MRSRTGGLRRVLGAAGAGVSARVVWLAFGMLLLAALPAAALGSVDANWSAGFEAAGVVTPVPPAPQSVPNVVSCAAAGDCSAITEYDDADNQPLLLTETGGVWAAGVKPDLPPGLGSNPDPWLESVSCGAPGDCSAVGYYHDDSGNQQGLVLTETASTWALGAQAQVPSGGGSGVLESVSCASAGDCTAVGAYDDSAGVGQGLLLTETGGVWGAGVEAALPANANPQPAVGLSAVSCASPGDCSAVGTYNDTAASGQGLLLTETDGVWGAGVEAALPANANSQPAVGLSSVSCASPGDCTAVGTYKDSSGNEQGLLLTETGGVWGAGVEAALPANANSQPVVSLGSVSCGSPGDCSAVGDYEDSAGNPHGLVLTETGGVWAAAGALTLPANAGTASAAALTSVSCAAAGECSAVGGYIDSSVGIQGLLLTETGGVWDAGVEATPPPGAAPDPELLIPSVSCAAPGACGAIGPYLDSSGDREIALFSATPVTPGMPVSAPGTGMASPVMTVPTVTGTGGTGAKPPASKLPAPKLPGPRLSAVKLGAKRFTAKHGTKLELEVSQRAHVNVWITEAVKGHRVKRACKHAAKHGKPCTATVTRKTMTFKAHQGANSFKLKLRGMHTGRYTAVVVATNAHGHSQTVKRALMIVPAKRSHRGPA